jgi:hypothetical protein
VELRRSSRRCQYRCTVYARRAAKVPLRNDEQSVPVFVECLASRRAADGSIGCMVSTLDRISLGNSVRDGVAKVWNDAAYSSFRDQRQSDAAPEIRRPRALYRGTF